MEVLPIAEARASLSRLVVDVATNPEIELVYLGSHRKPQAVLMGVDALERLRGATPETPSLTQLTGLSRVIYRLAGAANLSNVRVFGSVARGDAEPGSDIDLLVTTSENTTLFDIAQFELDMEELLGHSVTAVPESSLQRDNSDAAILRQAVAI